MPKETIIPAGYRLTVTTWENDGDHYKTKVKEGLTKEHTIALVALIKLFSSKNYGGDVGNMYDPNESERKQVKTECDKVFAKFPAEFNFETFDDDDFVGLSDSQYMLLCDLGLAGGDFYTRVMESFKVEYMPTEVRLSDVTDEFKA